MSDRPTDNVAANPVPKINNGSGFTKRELAAVMLRVPDSGLGWLDEMIRDSYSPNR